MKFEIHSYQGIGPIQFGMSPDDVRKALGVPFKSSQKGSESGYPSDYFDAVPCFVYYDKNGRAEAAEFAEPAEPTLNGINLLGLGFSDLVTLITKADAGLSIECDGFTSLHLGIGAYAPVAEDEPQTPPEGIIVFVRGYYD
jgi:hypothetical protein